MKKEIGKHVQDKLRTLIEQNQNQVVQDIPCKIKQSIINIANHNSYSNSIQNRHEKKSETLVSKPTEKLESSKTKYDLKKK